MGGQGITVITVLLQLLTELYIYFSCQQQNALFGEAKTELASHGTESKTKNKKRKCSNRQPQRKHDIGSTALKLDSCATLKGTAKPAWGVTQLLATVKRVQLLYFRRFYGWWQLC